MSYDDEEFEEGYSDELEDDLIVMFDADGNEQEFFVLGSVINKENKYLLVSENKKFDDGELYENLLNIREEHDEPDIVVLKKNIDINNKVSYEFVNDKTESDFIMKLFDDQLDNNLNDE